MVGGTSGLFQSKSKISIKMFIFNINKQMKKNAKNSACQIIALKWCDAVKQPDI